MNCCRCGRAICDQCIPKLAEALSSPNIARIRFCCPKCYLDDKITEKKPYFVSSSVFSLCYHSDKIKQGSEMGERDASFQRTS